jgi:uncharacterized Zn-binding protein involved in type VI secretion
MAFAVRVGDTTTHGGVVTGPGVANVIIAGQPAAVAGDIHVCAIPANTPHPQVSSFPAGSTTVLIGGKPALRTLQDMCICGAAGAAGATTVMIG